MRTGVIWLEAVLTAAVTFLAASFPLLGIRRLRPW